MIKDVEIFQPDRFEDFRGDIYTTWRNDGHLTKGTINYPKLNWRLDKFAHSRKNVLRGVHGDDKTTKLISCVYGKFYYVIADNRENSSTYKKWEWHILSAENRKQLLVPPGCGGAYFVLSDDCTFHYKLAFDGEYNDVANQFTIKWNDPEWNFEWPHNAPILYGRDR